MNVITFCLVLMTAFPLWADEKYEKLFSEQLKKHKVDRQYVGALVSSGEGESSKMMISVNPNKKMTPASITKILTSSAVLDNFLPGTKFKTQIILDQKPTKSEIKGPIYLKGGGDPSFVSENMWFLVNSFKRNGVESIDGDVIVDDSLFDSVRYDDSRESTRVDRAYDAPVGAMSFNWNSVNVFVRPGKKGEKASVFLDPDNSYSKLENKTKTIAGEKVSIEVHRKANGQQDVLVVEGSIGDKANENVTFKNITHPDLWSGHQLKAFLAQRGISVHGGVKSGVAPVTGYVAAEYESKPVEDILVDMNKFSNNYVAEMLTKNLGLKKKQPATIEAGMDMIREHLQRLGIESKDVDLVNPSGLTRENKVTPEAFWKVLRHLREDFRVQPEFLRSLPIAGIDGTLKKRMKGSGAERWVRAKTGFINGVVALAGYAGLKGGTSLTFVFIYNGPQDEAKVRQFYDDVLIDLVNGN
jgi:D-alanyl-D-alanine carboxypeptidase/D-alanyl-D-alanine-endopeptidase (penicillin-binding protein 4)